MSRKVINVVTGRNSIKTLDFSLYIGQELTANDVLAILGFNTVAEIKPLQTVNGYYTMDIEDNKTISALLSLNSLLIMEESNTTTYTYSFGGDFSFAFTVAGDTINNISLG
jgi:hypothetical protein